MSTFPELHDLVWLFESEPTIEDGDLGWPVSPATFHVVRGTTQIFCTIAPYEYSVDIRCEMPDNDSFVVRLIENVDTLTIDRTHGAEALVWSPVGRTHSSGRCGSN
jgi:hypothetical protein